MYDPSVVSYSRLLELFWERLGDSRHLLNQVWVISTPLVCRMLVCRMQSFRAHFILQFVAVPLFILFDDLQRSGTTAARSTGTGFTS